MYRSLHLPNTVQTILRLESRIKERFPDSGLSCVCAALHETAVTSKTRIDWISRPLIPVRIGVVATIMLALSLFIATIFILDMDIKVPVANDFVTLVDALLSTVVFIGASAFFLITLETRIKRARALDALHELRSIAHVVDMHQLTKDPSITKSGADDTASSPKRRLTCYQLRRYLDYCAEMQSLIGKLAAIYSQKLPDTAIVTAANEIEILCASLSRKIWQKIHVLTPMM